MKNVNTPREPLETYYPSNFEEFIKTKASCPDICYVDKTLFLYQLLTKPYTQVEMRPSGFGKTFNSTMARCFFDQSYKNNAKVKAFFENSLLYKSHPSFLDKHFGQYQVISIDFNKMAQIPDSINDSDKLMRFFDLEFYQLMLDIYQQFANRTGKNNTLFKDSKAYLKLCALATDKETSIFETAGKNIVSNSIYNLLQFFNCENVIVLVDGYDPLYEKAIELNCHRNIMYKIDDLFGYLRAPDTPRTTYISGRIPFVNSNAISISTMLNSETIRYDIDFRNHYGFTGDELKSSLSSNLDDNQLEQLNKQIGDYRILDGTVFCPRAVIMEYENRRPKERVLQEIIPKHRELSEYAIKSMQNKKEFLNPLLQAGTYRQHAMLYHIDMHNKHGLDFLYYQGFVSIEEKKEPLQDLVRITNREAATCLQTYLNADIQLSIEDLKQSMQVAFDDLIKTKNEGSMTAFKKCILQHGFEFTQNKDHSITIQLSDVFKAHTKFLVFLCKMLNSSDYFKANINLDNDESHIKMYSTNDIVSDKFLCLLKSELGNIAQKPSKAESDCKEIYKKHFRM